MTIGKTHSTILKSLAATRVPPPIPSGLSRVIFDLLHRAMRKRRVLFRSKTARAKALWLMPTGKFAVTYYPLNAPRADWLLVATKRGSAAESTSIVLGIIRWIAERRFTALADHMSDAELGEAFKCRFFERLGDPAGAATARRAFREAAKRHLIACHGKVQR